jgi:flagellum-specific peptidoglycan hydrolase FlgJ
MASQEQLDFLRMAYNAAQQAGHIFPQAAAAEAAVETAWGTSTLFKQANNVFGSKVPVHPNPVYGVISLPTREHLNGAWVTIEANFVHYPTVADSFTDRMATLTRLAPQYPHYAAALSATSPADFLVAVSQTWSTDPSRAATCISIMNAHADILK